MLPFPKNMISATRGIVIGSSNFEDVLKSSAFVDKTMLIKDVVDSTDKVLLITCPRRFGKSTNMNMIKTFLEIKLDKWGREITNYQHVFVNQDKNKNLKILQENAFVRNNLAKHPVIFVDFLNARGSTYQHIVNGVKLAISYAFKQHRYMIDVLYNIFSNDRSTFLQKKDAKECLTNFEKIYESNGQKADDIDIQNSLKFLSEVLYNHFNKKVYVLIDEYDAPMHSAIQNNIDLNEINSFMNGILCSVFKGNDTYLEKGIITGISGMVRASASFGLNNVTENKFLDNHAFSEHYGFTEAEVSALLREFDIKDQEEVETWYNGYLIKDKNSRIYNPWSIIQYIKNNKFDNYWEKSGGINNILNIFAIDDIRMNIIKLINNQEIDSLVLKTDTTITDLENLQKIFNFKDKIPQQQHSNLFFSYIFELGYLSFTQNKNSYKIPNKELKSEFIRNMVDYYLNTYNLSNEDFNNAIKKLDCLLQDMTTNNNNDFKTALDKLFAQLKKNGVHLHRSIVNILAIQSKFSKFGTEIWYKNEDLTQAHLIFKANSQIKDIKSLCIIVFNNKILDIKCELKVNSNYLAERTIDDSK